METRGSLTSGEWGESEELAAEIGEALALGDGTERVRIRIFDDAEAARFFRIRVRALFP